MHNMTRLYTLLLTLITVFISSEATSASTSKHRILMVVSSYGQQQGLSAPGYEFDEFAKAYLVFKEHELPVDITSPKGGKVEADKYDPTKSYNAEVLADNTIMQKLNNTLPSSEVNAEIYSAIFIVGGKGAMFDLPKDRYLQKIITHIYEQRGTVAAVCHGPAALINVRLENGNYLLANKRVNSFTNIEEKLFGKKWIKDFDFMLEDKLVERGGIFQSSDIMLNHVAVDQGLITGQNPSSTVSVATELVKSLGIKIKPMNPYKDDKTLALVAQILAGDEDAIQTLATNQENYYIQLVGMYGFYYLKTATSTQQIQAALTLMSLGQHAINNPKLDMQIAATQHKLGDANAAKNTLKQLLANTPDFQPALDLLKDM